MWPSLRITGLALFTFSFSLLAWLLYDATSVTETLGLGTLVGEGVVASLGLFIVAASLVVGFLLWRKGRGQAASGSAI